jgi:hypothetical protein
VDKAGKDGKITEKGLLAAAEKLFAEADKNKDGQLDEKELTEELNKFLAMPFGPPGGPPGGRPGAPTPGERERKREER